MIKSMTAFGRARGTVDGKDIFENPLEAKRLIGYLPETPPLYTDMTVEEYLNFVYDLKRCTLPRAEHIAKVCEDVRITDVRRRLIRNLSKGYRQRVGIAQALVGDPPVLIFDEPTVGLDPKQIIEVRNLLRTLAREHTVILSTHILPEVQSLCGRLLIISEGRIIADRRTEELARVIRDTRRFRLQVVCPQKEECLELLRNLPGIKRAEASKDKDGEAYCFTFESAAGVDVRQALFAKLADRKWPIYGLEAVGMDLEDIFLQLVDHPELPLDSVTDTRRNRK